MMRGNRARLIQGRVSEDAENGRIRTGVRRGVGDHEGLRPEAVEVAIHRRFRVIKKRASERCPVKMRAARTISMPVRTRVTVLDFDVASDGIYYIPGANKAGPPRSTTSSLPERQGSAVFTDRSEWQRPRAG
jgi:hypothetical protein